jgi:hypothetical protein
MKTKKEEFPARSAYKRYAAQFKEQAILTGAANIVRPPTISFSENTIWFAAWAKRRLLFMPCRYGNAAM